LFPKRFFHASCVAYILGLATTIFVMHTFQAAQPALLYLVPFCIGSSLLVGLSTGKLKELMSYEEESQNDKDKKKE
jgi:minor histocompatibility antigen H13